VYARAGEGFVEVLADRRHFTRSLRFTADGRGLFAGDALDFWREGATPREQKQIAYDPTLPHGFVRLVRSGDEWQMPGDDGKSYSHLADAGSVAMFRNEKIGVEVMVTALDPDEIDGDGDAEAWALRLAERHFRDTPLTTKKERRSAGFAVWGGPGEGRSMELHWTASGCEDMDNYDRVSERDGALYHVHLHVYGILPKKRVVPWLTAFIDEPLGPSPARASAKAAPAHPRNPAKKHKHGRKKG
jgi:hypothetical protein